MDTETDKVFHYLDKCLQNNDIVNISTVDRYILRVKTNPTIIGANVDLYLSRAIPTISSILRSFDYVSMDDSGIVCDLLDSILSQVAFDKLLTIYPLESLLEAISSSIPSICTLGLKLIAKSEPPDILANTPVLMRMINLFVSPETPIKVIDAIELCMSNLMKGELMRRRFASAEVMSILLQMKNTGTTTQKSRIMALVVRILPYFKQGQLPSELYKFQERDCETSDVLFVAIFNQFYTDLLNYIKETYPQPRWLLEDIQEQIDIVVKLYNKRNGDELVKQFCINEIIGVFAALSFVDVSTFNLIDSEFSIIKGLDLKEDYSILLLSTINPAILMNEEPIIKSIPLNSRTIHIYMNIMSVPDVFQILKNNQLNTDFKRQQLSTVLLLSLRLADFPTTTKFLLQSSQLMNILTDSSTSIANNEVLEIKKKALEKILIKNSKEDLSVWYESVKSSYDLITKGKTFAAVPVVSTEYS